MNTKQASIIESSKQSIVSLYRAHEGDGILAIYIWGSITRSDFDFSTSDIDVICVVSEDFPLEDNEIFKQELTTASPEREWGFQIIYLDELNGGPLQSRLSKAMSPQTILPSFGSWIQVAGKDFKRDDFAVEDASLPERMTLNIEEIRRRLKSIANAEPSIRVRHRKGVVKAGLQLIYNRQLTRSEHFDLDYNVLARRADEKENPILDDLTAIKQQGLYTEDAFNPYVPALLRFAREIEQELEA